jgi:hypothetical protein
VPHPSCLHAAAASVPFRTAISIHFVLCSCYVLLQVWGTQSVLHFFSSNEPWRTYTHNGNFEFRQLQPGVELRLSEAVSVTAAAVPHRAEFSDAVGYYIKVRAVAAHALHT